MGGKLSRFTPEELSIYESCTCLDGAELTTVYDKFIKMGGRWVTKASRRGELQKGHRAQDCEEPDGRVGCSRAFAGPWRLARTPFAREGTSTMPPHALSRMPSPGGAHTQRAHTQRAHTQRAHTQRTTFPAHTQRTTFPGGDEHGWRGRLDAHVARA